MDKKILLILPLICLLAACTPEPSLTLDRETVSFGTEGGTELVNVSANYAWTASSSAAWISIQYMEGSQLLTIKATANPEKDARQGSVTVKSEGLSKTVSVTQAQLDAIELSDGELIEIDASEQTVQIPLSANVELSGSVTQGAAWCKLVTVKGMTAHTATLSVSANPELTERTAVVVFSGADAQKVQVSIRQSGAPQLLSFRVEGLAQFTLPTINPIDGYTFRGYLWNGEKQQEYSAGTVVALDPANAYDLRIEGHNAASVHFDTVEGLTDIDFLGLE